MTLTERRSSESTFGAARHRSALPHRLLVVESANQQPRFDTAEFTKRGMELLLFPDAATALLAIPTEKPSVVVVPTDLDGVDLNRFVSAVSAWTEIPVVIGIIPGAESADIGFEALQSGARALIPFPFTAEQVVGSLRALNLQPEASDPVVSVGSVILDISAFRVTVDGCPIHFSPREMVVLEYLLRESPRAVSVDELATALAEDDGPHLVAMRRMVAKVRQKLNAKRIVLSTVHGVGYRLTG